VSHPHQLQVARLRTDALFGISTALSAKGITERFRSSISSSDSQVAFEAEVDDSRVQNDNNPPNMSV
jgi:hypothetical protein